MFRRIVLAVAVVGSIGLVSSNAEAGRWRRVHAYRPAIVAPAVVPAVVPVRVATPVVTTQVSRVTYYRPSLVAPSVTRTSIVTPSVASTIVAPAPVVHRTYRVAPAVVPAVIPSVVPAVVPARRVPLVPVPLVRPVGVYVW